MRYVPGSAPYARRPTTYDPGPTPRRAAPRRAAASSAQTRVTSSIGLAPGSHLIARQVLDQLAEHDVSGDRVRVADFDARPGVEKDMGDCDQWPEIRDKIIAADIVIVASPTWVGHMSSVAQWVLERLDAELSEIDEQGRPSMVGKVALAAVVGERGRGTQDHRGPVPGAQRCGVHHPARGNVLERRSDAEGRLE